MKFLVKATSGDKRIWSANTARHDVMYLQEFQSTEGTSYVDATPHPVPGRIKYIRALDKTPNNEGEK